LRRARVLEPRRLRGVCLNLALQMNDVAKKLLWTGLLAGVGAVSSTVTYRVATEIWIRVFKEDPPVD
jgi:hypothetical protein